MKLRMLHRSMFGQMAFITILFIGFGIYFFAVRPLLSVEPSGVVDPLDETAGRVAQVLSRYASEAHEGRGGDLKADPTLNAIQTRNPAFRYFVRVADRETRSGQGTPFFISEGYDRLAAQRLGAAYPDLCQNLVRHNIAGSGRSYVSFTDCAGRLSYVEFAGLEQPITGMTSGTLKLYERFVWSSGGIFLFTIALVFVIFAVILMANVRRIRRVARLAEQFDPDDLQARFPEEGLPLEVSPLVTALNRMIVRVDDAQRRQRFFLSAAAHELRTPLAVLRTRLEILEDGRTKDKLVSDVRRLTVLANQLLSLMTIGEKPGPLKRVDLVTLTGRAVGEREAMAARRGLNLVFEREVTRYALEAEAGLVETAIGNVIDNALSFSAQGQSIRVRLHKDGWVRVQDQGPGIPADQVKDLFEPFTRFSTGRAGYGLGLAIVKAVIDRHRGAVEVREAPGGGAEVSLRFEP